MITVFVDDSEFSHRIQRAMDSKNMFYATAEPPFPIDKEDSPVMKVGERFLDLKQALAWIKDQPCYSLD